MIYILYIIICIGNLLPYFNKVSSEEIFELHLRRSNGTIFFYRPIGGLGNQLFGLVSCYILCKLMSYNLYSNGFLVRIICSK